jgi:F-type H+-transporting ATPase subunit epsilon
MFHLNLVTPERKIVFQEELEEIILPAHSGELNVLKGHSPLMTTLEPGVLKYKLKSGESKTLAISWGYCQVSAIAVNVLAETATTRDEINEPVVRDQLKREETRLSAEHLNDKDWNKVQHEVSRLKAVLQLLK